MNILCKFGFHKMDKNRYFRVKRKRGKHKWHRNYVVCARCGKLYAPVSLHKMREG